MSDQHVDQDLRKLADTIRPLAEQAYRQLRQDHPHLAEYLDLTILARPVWGGGYDVLGEIYPTPESAEEARQAAIMHKLIQADRAPK